MKARIALTNQICTLLSEHGVTLRQGAAGLREAVADALADGHNPELSVALREMLAQLIRGTA